MGKIMMNGIQYGVGGIEQAKDISYDNTESGATATDVQGALDELNAGLTWEQVATGTGTVNADFSGYSELYILAKWSGNQTIKVGLFVIQPCLYGAYIMGKNDHSVRIDVSTTQIKVTEWNFGGSNTGSSCPLLVYGR